MNITQEACSGVKTFRKRPLMCFYIYLFGITRLSSMKATDQTDSAIKCLTGDSAGILQKGLRSERQ